MNTIEYKGYQIRPDTMDKYVVDELRSYRGVDIEPGSTVLDIGANIGVFSKWAAGQGAGLVIAVEPDAENFQLLQTNTAPWDVATFQAAVVRNSHATPTVPLYLATGPNKGNHITGAAVRGRPHVDVPTISWSELLERKPSVIKIDCEGAEYEFLDPTLIPECTDEVIMEYHLNRKGQREAATRLHTEFMNLGWTCVKIPRLGTGAWHTMAHYVRGYHE
jgi:FkbM family methyltransferase